MTGFGSSEVNGFKVELRSLNHRYLDISVRMPSALMEHEIPVRNLIKDRFARGKFDITISLTDKRQLKVGINKELAAGMYKAFSELQSELSIPGSLTIDFFSGYRELVLNQEPDYSPDALYEALKIAISRIEEMRRGEGETLRKELQDRSEKLADIRSQMEALSGEVVVNYREHLSKRVAELASGTSIDEARLAQEIAFMAQKSDITEELARLTSHFKQFNSLLSKGDVIGRRLDFILQEMNREVNTVGSKMDDIRIVNLGIEMKTEMEKLREQVQNIQ